MSIQSFCEVARERHGLDTAEAKKIFYDLPIFLWAQIETSSPIEVKRLSRNALDKLFPTTSPDSPHKQG